MPEATTVPPPPPPPPTPKPTGPDPFLARILDDMGMALSDGKVVDAPPKAPDTARNVLDGEFISMGEHARWKKEKKEAEDEAAKAGKPPGDKPPETPPGTKDEKKADEPPKSDDKPKTSETPPPTPPKKKPIEVEKAKPIEEIVEGVVRRITKEQPAPPLPEPPKTKQDAPASDPDSAFVESLDEDQKDALELAQFAAKAMPDKYGNFPKRTVDYLKKVDQFIDEKRKEDPDWDPKQDQSFAEFIEENRPEFQPGDRRKLERQQIADQVRADVEKEFKPKMEATERAEFAREAKPKIDAAVESYEAAIAQRFIPDEKSPFYAPLKAASEKDPTYKDEAWEAAKAVDPLATAVARSFMNQAKALGREYFEIVAGVSQQVPLDPKQPLTAPVNQKALTQQRLFGFIEQQEKIFAQNGGDMRFINGRSFVSRAELAAMPPAEQAKHWTLGHNDVLDMLAVAAATQATQALNAEIKRREDEGYVKNGKHASAKKEEQPPPKETKREESPKTTVTPAPGAANQPPPPPSNTVFTEDELKKQWSGGASLWAG